MKFHVDQIYSGDVVRLHITATHGQRIEKVIIDDPCKCFDRLEVYLNQLTKAVLMETLPHDTVF